MAHNCCCSRSNLAPTITHSGGWTPLRIFASCRIGILTYHHSLPVYLLGFPNSFSFTHRISSSSLKSISIGSSNTSLPFMNAIIKILNNITSPKIHHTLMPTAHAINERNAQNMEIPIHTPIKRHNIKNNSNILRDII